jgi:hypothetical protein
MDIGWRVSWYGAPVIFASMMLQYIEVNLRSLEVHAAQAFKTHHQQVPADGGISSDAVRQRWRAESHNAKDEIKNAPSRLQKRK